jgi:hypothetical protein
MSTAMLTEHSRRHNVGGARAFLLSSYSQLTPLIRLYNWVVAQENAKNIVGITNYGQKEWDERRPYELYAELYMLTRWNPGYLERRGLRKVINYFEKGIHMWGWAEYTPTSQM